MCSIVGMAFQRGHKMKNNAAARTIMRRLLVEGMSRGRRASGVAFVTAKEIAVVKKDVPSSTLVGLEEYKNAEDRYMDLVKNSTGDLETIAVHGHCRLPTKGSERNNANNHPITYGRVVGAHNGVICNDDDLFSQHSELTRIGQVDSEVIFALANHYSEIEYEGKKQEAPVTNAIKKTVKLLKGSFACSLSHINQPHCLFLFRNNSPCEIMHFQSRGLILWASSMAFIRNAIENYDLGEPTEIKLLPHSGLGIDLANSKINHFNFNYNEEAY